MYVDQKLLIAQSDKPIYILPNMINRHGIISGATGTGKTTTLKVLAESLSDMGVPVFLSDIKGDLAGMCQPGINSEDMQKRITKFGLSEKGWSYKNYPTRFWDIFGEKGHPVRTTISDMGPLLLSRLLGLNDTQAGVLNIVFRIADDTGMLLLDLKDLRAMLSYVAANSKSYVFDYGNIAPQSVGAIQRALLMIEDQGGDMFFGEPALEIKDWIKSDGAGRGHINILDCVKLFHSPALYSTFLLWMLSDLYETMPEVGDLDIPKVVFFFDEAHLLFDDIPKVLLNKIEQVVRLVRSKGIGIYFITQNPKDIPDSIASQLGNKVQHALRAYSPAEQKVIRAAADSFRPNPKFSTAEAISELKTGEALVSFLQEDGSPSIVERASILPPQSLMGEIDDSTRRQAITSSEFFSKYDEMIDRESAYELLQYKYEREDQEKRREEMLKQRLKEEEAQRKIDEKEAAAREKERIRQEKAIRKTFYGTTTTSKTKTPIERLADNAIGTIGRQVGNQLFRSILGSMLKPDNKK